MLLALGGAVVPLVIHLIGRQRAPRVDFAAVDYLLRSHRKVAQRVRLRHLLLLAVRMLLLATLALMVARPYRMAPVALLVGDGPSSVVLIVDDTASMRRLVGGEMLFARAKRRARKLVNDLSDEAEVAVVALSAPQGPLVQLTRDRREALHALARIEAGFGHAKLTGALSAARRILGRGAIGSRQVFIFSDLAAHSMDAGSMSTQARSVVPDVRVEAIDVAPANTANHAVVALSAKAAPLEGHRAMRIEARVCNHSREAVTLRPRLEVDDNYVARGRISLKAGTCGTKAFYHTFKRSGVHRAVVSIGRDSFEADDRRYLYLEVESPLRVLLINGDPSPLRHRDELFYLRAALETPSARQRPMVISVSDTAALEGAALATLDVVALCNVRGASAKASAALEAFVGRGGGLFITLGAHTDAGAFNAALGTLLPQPLRGGAGVVGSQAALHLGRVDERHPIFTKLALSAEGVVGLAKSRFFRTYRLKPAPERRGRALLSYDDGSPALVEGAVGEGRVLLLTTSVDREWTDLPIRPGYLPLMQQIVRYLGRAAAGGRHTEVLVGARRQVVVDASWDRVELRTPEGEHVLDRSALGSEGQLEVVVDTPGFYQLRAADPQGRWQSLDSLGFGANLDPAESRLDKGKIESSASVAAKVSQRPRRRVSLAHTLAFFVLLLLGAEALLTRHG